MRNTGSAHNKSLASGNGSGHSTVVMYFVLCLVVGLAALGAFFWLANNFGYTTTIFAGRQRNSMWTWFRFSGIIVAVTAALEGLFLYLRCAGTEITVYEHEVRGQGVGLSPLFSATDRKRMDFILTYDQISTVDVTNGKILDIHTPGSKYRCFVQNASEIRDTILKQKKLTNQST